MSVTNKDSKSAQFKKKSRFEALMVDALLEKEAVIMTMVVIIFDANNINKIEFRVLLPARITKPLGGCCTETYTSRIL